MKATVYIKLREAVLDPQGKAVEGALKDLGFSGVRGVRVGKMIEMTLDGTTEETANARVEAADARVEAAAKVEAADARLEAVNAGLETANAGLEAVNARLETANAGLEAVNARLETANAGLEAVNAKVRDMCERVLVNTVIEDYHFVISSDGPDGK
jgi:phosphoribosylformylglycinamidine synthase